MSVQKQIVGASQQRQFNLLAWRVGWRFFGLLSCWIVFLGASVILPVAIASWLQAPVFLLCSIPLLGLWFIWWKRHPRFEVKELCPTCSGRLSIESRRGSDTMDYWLVCTSCGAEAKTSVSTGGSI